MTPKQASLLRKAITARTAHLASLVLPAISNAATARTPEAINTNAQPSTLALAHSLRLLAFANDNTLDIVHISAFDQHQLWVGIGMISSTMSEKVRQDLDTLVASFVPTPA